ncbi:MAG: hypothetical protein AAGA80_03775 [Cyanobacteria bacterium P01_F01_bin.143]
MGVISFDCIKIGHFLSATRTKPIVSAAAEVVQHIFRATRANGGSVHGGFGGKKII